MTQIAEHAEPLRPQSAPQRPRLTQGEHGVQTLAAGQPRLTVVGGEQRHGVARVAVVRVARELGADLVVPKAEVVRAADGQIVVGIQEAAVGRQPRDALLREQVVQLELTDLQVGPGRVAQVVEADERRLEPGGAVGVQRRHEAERDVLVQGPEHQEVDAGQVEAGLVDGLPSRCRVGDLVRGALEVQLRRGAHGDGPVGVVLPDRRIAVVAQLIPVVLESLSEGAQLGPNGVTDGTAQSVLTRKRGDGFGLVYGERVGRVRFRSASAHRHGDHETRARHHSTHEARPLHSAGAPQEPPDHCASRSRAALIKGRATFRSWASGL